MFSFGKGEVVEGRTLSISSVPPASQYPALLRNATYWVLALSVRQPGTLKVTAAPSVGTEVGAAAKSCGSMGPGRMASQAYKYAAKMKSCAHKSTLDWTSGDTYTKV